MERLERAEAERAAPGPAHAHGLKDHSRLHVVFQNLNDVLEKAPVVVIISDAKGVIEYVNPRFEESTGFTQEEAVGLHLSKIAGDPELNPEAWAARAAGRGWQGEIRYPRADGSIYWARSSIQPVFSSDGTIARYFAIHVEISDQKHLEQELAIREAHWEALAGAPSFIGLIDNRGRIKRINRVTPDLQRSDVEGTSAFDYLPDEYHSVWKEALEAVFERGEQRSFEYAGLMGPGGPVTWFHSAIGPVNGADGIKEAMVITTDLSEHKAVEDALRQSEAYWRALVKSAPAFIVTLNAEGRITTVNRELDGGKPEDAVGQTIYDFGEEVAHGRIREALARVFDGAEMVQLENRAALTSGEVRYWSYVIGPVCLEEQVVGAVLVSHDITERKEAEEKLRASEARWRALLEAVPDYVLMVDREGVIRHLNRAAPGGSTQEMVGRTVYEYMEEAYHDEWRRALQAVFEGEKVTLEVRSRNMGEPRWFSSSLGPVCDGSKVKAAVVVARDVTLRRTAEERVRAFATAVPDLIVVVDFEGVIQEVLGPEDGPGPLAVPAAEVRGRLIRDLLPEAQYEKAIAFVRNTIEGGRALEGEAPFGFLWGPTWILGRSAPLTLTDGRTVAVIHVSDISERRRLEEELAALREEVEAQAEARQADAAELGLTFREVTVLSLIARGCTDKEIAGLLGVSPFTVNKQSASAVRKVKARSRSEAVAVAVRAGVI
ncbi:MAG TPA: PAS domain S-box protein [Dehalococcoidia bacterium]|nr:PAS domain S-box protein [Dehalococcoidia bacterium]